MEKALHTIAISKTGREAVRVTRARDIRTSIRSAEDHANSTELLQQLSDLVDGLVSLSAPSKDFSANTSNASGWSLFEHAQRLMSVTGVCRETSERALFSR